MRKLVTCERLQRAACGTACASSRNGPSEIVCIRTACATDCRGFCALEEWINVPMKIAVPAWQGRVSPVFDVAEQLVLVDLDEPESHPHPESLGSTTLHDRARRLAELGVDVLVCGAISWPLEAVLVSHGIRVVPLVCGEVEEVVKAFRDGTLEEERFAMPGCCRKRSQTRTRCRRRGGSTPEDSP